MTDKQQKLLRARIALSLYQELKRRPTDEELTRYLRVLAQALQGFTLWSGGMLS